MRNTKSSHHRNAYRILLVLLATWLGSAGLTFAQDENGKPAQEKIDETDQSKSETGTLTKKQSTAIQIKMDAQGPIFVYDTTGGYRVKPVTKPEPKLQVFADGKISVGVARGPNLESRLSEAELVDFLNFVVNKNGIYEIDSQDILKRMEGKVQTQLADATSTVFVIDLEKGKHEVSVYALWNALRNFPDFDELRRLTAIEKRCNSIISRLHLGDDKDAVLTLVNEQVAAKSKELGLKIAPLTIVDMRLASRLANGRFQVSFETSLPGADSEAESSKLNVIYFRKSGDAKPEVQFYGLPVK